MLYFHKTTEELPPVGIELMLIFPTHNHKFTGFYRIDKILEIKDKMCKLKRLNDWCRLPTFWQVSELSPDKNEDYL